MYLCIAVYRDQDPDKVPQHFLQQRLKKIKLKLEPAPEPAPEPGQNGMATQLCSWPGGKKNIFALCIYTYNKCKNNVCENSTVFPSE